MSRSTVSRGWVVAVGAVSVVAAIAVAMLVLCPATRRGNAGTALPVSVSAQPAVVSPATQQSVRASYAALPLAFEANQGQADPQVKYMARASGYTMFLTQSEAVFSFSPQAGPSVGRGHGLTPYQPIHERGSAAVVRMRLVGGNSHSQLASMDPLPGKINYYLGNDPGKWHSGVPQCARVSYRTVYPGIDLAYYGERSKLEFDFIVAPGSNPESIGLSFDGAKHLESDASGNLVVASGAGDVVFHKPVAYQEGRSGRQSVEARFVLTGKQQVNFKLGRYDRSRELVIDPSVTYATYLGGTGEDDGYGIAIDSGGDAYVTGQTASTNFPVAGGVAPNTNAGGFDAFVTKFNADGSGLIYSTYVGGSGNDSGNAVAVDGSGNAFVAGGTTSADFPTAGAAFQTSNGGGVDAFVFELNPGGTALTYSTYLGGSGDDVATGIAIDGTGSYVVGSTGSANFPTHNPQQSSIAGTLNGFVTKLNPAGSALLYSTYLGGGTGDFAAAVAVNSGNAYVTGAAQNAGFPTTNAAFQPTCSSCTGALPDAFVTVYDAAGTAFVYSTFLGGSGTDQGLGIAVDSTGAAYVAGLTESSDFPVQSAWQKTFGGMQDAFVAQLNPQGTALVYSTFLGGSQSDAATGITLDVRKNVYVTGQTQSSDFPLATPTQATSGGGNDAFVSELNSAGLAVFSTYLGGGLNENTNAAGASLAALGSIAVDSAGDLYVTGNTLSTDFPTVGPEQASLSGGIDAFVAKYAIPTGPDFSISATTPGAVGPGASGTSTVELISLNGYSSSVTLSCSVSGAGSPAPACSASSAFSPNPVTPTASSVTSTLTITTTPNQSASSPRSRIFYAMWLPITGLSLMGMGFSGARSRPRKLFGFLMIGLVMTALFLMPACGSSSTTTITGCNGCTPSGNYTVTITGAGSDANTTTHSTQVILAVN